MPPSLPAFDVNLLMHQGRSAMLRSLPRGASVFLSAGCSGTWFFEWIETCYGPVPRHVGVEYYTEKPSDLPSNVEWVSNNCSDMSLVPSGFCDLLFSGQNLEHLWPEEVIGFFQEAARVTSEGGLLVLDSPNRTITEMMRTWSHPEHTIEFKAAEAEELVTAAGFDVSASKGILLCRDPGTGTLLPPPDPAAVDWSVTERMMLGVERPEDSILWWVEARRNGAEPDMAYIRRRVYEIFAAAWPERVRRTSIGVGQIEFRMGEEWVRHPAATGGPIVYGPYMPLPKGRYEASFHLYNPGPDQVVVRCDVIARDHANPLQQVDVTVEPGYRTVPIDFGVDQLVFGVEMRCLSYAQGAILCRRATGFRQLSRGDLVLDGSPGDVREEAASA